MKLKLIKFLILNLILLFNINILFAANCGGDVSCFCGDTVISNYNLTSDLVCPNKGLYINSGNLNCLGNSIIGNNSNNGISIFGYDNIKIKNCNIENFTNGIELSSRTIYLNMGYIGKYIPKYSNNILISNNFFNNNLLGIKSNKATNSQISKNKFNNNKAHSIYLDEPSTATIWQNEFYNKSPFFVSTAGKFFCKNNISNFFYNNKKEPNCDCIIPHDNLIVNSNTNFCNGKYELKKPINLHSNVKLNCKGSTLFGVGAGKGLVVAGYDNSQIVNCTFKNFSIAIELTSRLVYQNRGYVGRWIYKYPSNIKIQNNSFLLNRYNIYNNNLNYQTNAKGNFWGTNNLTLIENKFLKPQNIYYLPFIKSEISDLFILEKNLILKNNSINLIINKSINYDFGSFEIEILKIVNSKLIDKKLINISDFYSKSLQINIAYNLSDGDEVHIILDPNNKLIEDKSNNYIKKKYSKKPIIYIESNLDLKFLNNEIIDFFKFNFKDYIFSKNKSEAEILLFIEKENINNYNNINILNLQKNNIYYLKSKKPYEGKIISNISNRKNKIYFKGNDIEGVLALVKNFVKNKEIYLENKIYTIEINDTNLDAIGIYDYMHSLENNILYKQNNNLFLNIVRNVLYDKKYKIDEFFLPISYENGTIDYRLQRIYPQNEINYRNLIDKDNLPIILGGGLWSNIETWSELGKELANKGFEVYLIELTGSENSECDNCYNYNYSYLTKNVYPSYIDYILNLSQKNKVKYVGHSNGARVPITSLSNGFVNPNLVDTFIAVGVPGVFEGKSFLRDVLLRVNNKISQNTINKTHISFMELGSLGFLKTTNSNSKISKNLWKDYFNWMNTSNDIQPGKNLSLNNFFLIGGDFFFNNNDGIVTVVDEEKIFANIGKNSINSKYYMGNFIHMGMSEKKEIKKLITNFLKNKK